MNKRDRSEIARLAAKWEWSDVPEVASAVTVSNCREDLLEAFEVSEFDINWARCVEICHQANIDLDDDLFDTVFDLVDDEYETLKEWIEKVGFSGLAALLSGRRNNPPS